MKKKPNILKTNIFFFDINLKMLLPDNYLNKTEVSRTAGSKLTKADAGRFLNEILKIWDDVVMPEFLVKKKKLPKYKAGGELGIKNNEKESNERNKKVKRFINADA